MTPVEMVGCFACGFGSLEFSFVSIYPATRVRRRRRKRFLVGLQPGNGEEVRSRRFNFAYETGEQQDQGFRPAVLAEWKGSCEAENECAHLLCYRVDFLRSDCVALWVA